MGLGKTVVACLDLVPPAVVVCTAAMKYTWLEELNLWRPSLKVQVIDSPWTKIDKAADVHVINYDIAGKVKLPWPETLVVDEAQKIKTPTAKRTKVVLGMAGAAERVRFLSGTPMLSRPVELFPILSALGVVSPNWDRYTRRYCAAWETPWGSRDVSGASNLDELAEIVAPVMLRLTKKQVAPQLPDKAYRIVALSGDVTSREVEFLDYLDHNLELPKNPVAFQAISDIRRVHAERKLPQAIDYIKDLLDQSDKDFKLVVFAHHRASVEGLSAALKDYGVVTVMGGMSAQSIQDCVKAFQNSSKVRVFVGNLQAAGEGLTLTAAHHVVIVEPSWVPGEIHQAADRCHRLTTKFPVTVDLLTVQGSIDARMLLRVLEKTETIDQVIKETKMAKATTTPTSPFANLAGMFRAMADELESIVIGTTTNSAPDEEAPKTTRRSRSAPEPEDEAPKSTRRSRSAKDEDEEAPKPARRSRSAKDEDEDEEEEKPTRSSRRSSKDEDEKGAPALGDVRRVASKLIAARKRDILQEILEDFDAADIADLKEADYAEFITEVEKELA